VKSSQKNAMAVRRRIFRVDWKVGEVWETLNTKNTPLQGVFFVCSGRGASQHGKRDVVSCFPCWGGRRGGAGEGGPANARNTSKAVFRVLGWKQKQGGPLNTQNTPMWRVLGV